MPTPESFLRLRGFAPLPWEEVLQRIERQLGPEFAPVFARLHRAFVAYPVEHTCKAFYDFVARHQLLDLLGCHRFDRMVLLAASLEMNVPSGARVLDYGAGGGVLAQWLRETKQASISALDLSPAVSAGLAAKGFSPPLAGETFDVLLCADSLGEIHADEDDWLSDPENAVDDGFGGELEARYGFAHKLADLKTWLAPQGTVLLFEPVTQAHFWRGAAAVLETADWQVEVLGPAPVWGLRLQQQG